MLRSSPKLLLVHVLHGRLVLRPRHLQLTPGLILLSRGLVVALSVGVGATGTLVGAGVLLAGLEDPTHDSYLRRVGCRTAAARFSNNYPVRCREFQSALAYNLLLITPFGLLIRLFQALSHSTWQYKEKFPKSFGKCDRTLSISFPG